MTVTYSRELCNARLFGFARLLIRWRGSIYRLLWGEAVVFLALYYLIAIIYRFLLHDRSKRRFEKLAKYCEEYTNLVPITFVLGFYIAPLVLSRWWSIFCALPWPDKAINRVAWYVKGRTERSRMVKRTFARYLNLMLVLTLQSTSVAVKRRFPTTAHIVDAGLMTDEEARALAEQKYSHPKWWIPSTWYQLLLREANADGLISDGDARQMNDDMLEYRQNCATLWNFDWVSIPLAYTQVVSIAVYSFFLATLVGRQYVENAQGSSVVNEVFPFFTFVQFVFYMGWLKVGEELANPLGEDDEDFEVNWLIDRNLQTSFLIIDGILTHPGLVRDKWWQDMDLPELPYTTVAAEQRSEPFMGSANDMPIPQNQMEWHIETIPEEPGEGDPEGGERLPLTQSPSGFRRFFKQLSRPGRRSQTSMKSAMPALGGSKQNIAPNASQTSLNKLGVPLRKMSVKSAPPTALPVVVDPLTMDGVISKSASRPSLVQQQMKDGALPPLAGLGQQKPAASGQASPLARVEVNPMASMAMDPFMISLASEEVQQPSNPSAALMAEISDVQFTPPGSKPDDGSSA